jgi:hypothetical protein
MNMNAYTNMVDRLTEIDADMAHLKAERDLIANVLKTDAAGGFAEFEGTETVVTVSTTIRDTIDWKAIAAKLEPSRQLIVGNTTSKPVTTLKVVGKRKLAA